MFQALARDQLERLNASPSATPWTYLRVSSALLFIILIDVLCIRLWFSTVLPLQSIYYLHVKGKGAVLAGCNVHGNAHTENENTYLLLSTNVYTSVGKWKGPANFILG
ncbi:unnamed protein product [Trifolium pratense]|uniref:Uncharacterized protein n=1 Tax=Trifolium pratense TaxID=57577 RepID=A0ACB0LXL8_TRIPR|nr:unnamed protein product [Trifolium pratense]